MPVEDLTDKELNDTLAYVGLILVAYELVKSLIVQPIVAFYKDITFHEGSPFKSYEQDVAFRHKNQFEACLLYLRDFMQAIDAEDVMTIQALRKHRNDLAHDLPAMIHNFKFQEYMPLLEQAKKALFKLSNHQIYIEIGSDPRFRNQGIDWDTIKGPQFELFENVLNRLRFIEATDGAA